MTEQELNEIEARAKEALEGPWTATKNTMSVRFILDPEFLESSLAVETPHVTVPVNAPLIPRGLLHHTDAEFIAHAREDVPKLIAEVRRLRAFLEEEAGKIEWAECLCDEIDPADRPCIVCESRQQWLEERGLPVA